jgi:hypothetical protein
MKRKAEIEKVERLYFDRLYRELEPLRQKIMRWAVDHQEELQNGETSDLPELNDRANDSWRPLLAIADLAGGEWPKKAREAARTLSGAGQQDDSIRVQLLIDLKYIFDNCSLEALPTSLMIEKLVELEEHPWCEWRNGKAITPKQLANLLRPFQITPKQLWIGGRKVRGYERNDLEDPFGRYITLSDAVEAVGSSADAGLNQTSNPVEESDPTVLENDGNGREQGVLPDLPDKERGIGGIEPFDTEPSSEEEIYRA